MRARARRVRKADPGEVMRCVRCGGALDPALGGRCPQCNPSDLPAGQYRCAKCATPLLQVERVCWKCGHERPAAVEGSVPRSIAEPVALVERGDAAAPEPTPGTLSPGVVALVLAFLCVLPVGGFIAAPVMLYHVGKAYKAGQAKLATAALVVGALALFVSFRVFATS
ncbi:MAG: hypothetical protein HPY69_06140 [Armatimonadetes bacterium]|nr:hypothetical protein [Armatimonadota bacterium]